MRYQGPCPEQPGPGPIGLLLTNLGTPDSPEVRDVRRYLKEFLSDPRVVETPRLIWWLVLNGVILRTRPQKSAAAYREVWTEQGSPLLRIARSQANALQSALDPEGRKIVVELGMRYGNPSIASALQRLRQANARRVLLLPLYPQYSATTTGSTMDALGEVLRGWRWMPELRTINDYHQDRGFIDALAQSVRSFQQEKGQPEKLLMSFHGIPQSYADAGDPYPLQCRATAEALAARLDLPAERWQISFQSRIGRQRWLTPYTDETLKQWGADGVKSVQVICPGFSADCLETIEEIGVENRDYYLQSGGVDFHYIPALNDRPEHIDALAKLVRRHLWQ